MFLFLTVLQAIVAAALVGVILMQRNEGGGLGIGGSPSGMLSARGAADFLTRATKWLAVAFVVLSIILAVVAAESTGDNAIESTLDRTVAPVQQPDPLGGPAAGAPAEGTAPAATPQTQASDAATPASDDPLKNAAQ